MRATLPNGALCIARLENMHGEAFVAAETDGAQKYATWQINDNLETFWGHYFSTHAEAMQDLAQRAGLALAKPEPVVRIEEQDNPREMAHKIQASISTVELRDLIDELADLYEPTEDMEIDGESLYPLVMQ